MKGIVEKGEKDQAIPELKSIPDPVNRSFPSSREISF